MSLEALEAAVLQKLLNGDHPVLTALRDQMDGLSVRTRKNTGAGFFTEFSTVAAARPASAPPGKIRFGDVQATVDGLKNGAGFLLLIEQGVHSARRRIHRLHGRVAGFRDLWHLASSKVVAKILSRGFQSFFDPHRRSIK